MFLISKENNTIKQALKTEHGEPRLGFREFIFEQERKNILRRVETPVSADLEIAGILKAIEPTPVLFDNVVGFDYRVVGNLFATKAAVAEYLGISTQELIPTLTRAIDSPTVPEVIENAPCQEVVEDTVDLDKIPFLVHSEHDGGRYITSAVVITNDDEWGQNMSYHRALQFDKDKMAVRVVKGRHFHRYLEKNGELDVAFCVGNPANIMVAGAISVDIDVDELHIANSLEPIRLVKAKTSDLLIPADCEFVLEGKVYLEERHDEGPFIDLTETLDIIRQEPVFEVKKITHRKDAIWQALLSGGLEHKVLMGMPREPTIFREVTNLGVECLDVNLSPGGCSWLHATVKIRKKEDDDGKKAIQGAFAGHGSLKHCFVVDDDIDIYNPLDIEWAMATRFQADQDLVIRGREPGSSLDPSAEPGTRLTTKVGFDLTMPVDPEKRKHAIRAGFPRVELDKYF